MLNAFSLLNYRFLVKAVFFPYVEEIRLFDVNVFQNVVLKHRLFKEVVQTYILKAFVMMINEVLKLFLAFHLHLFNTSKEVLLLLSALSFETTGVLD